MRQGIQNGRPRIALALGMLAFVLAAARTAGQGVAYTGAASGDDAEMTTPVAAMVRANGRLREITLVGRNKEGLLFTQEDTGATRFVLQEAQVEDVEFKLPYEPGELMDAVHHRKWRTAVRILDPAVRPTLPYLDLPQNNAAEPALQLGEYMMRAAERLRRGSPGASQQAVIEEMVTAAYHVFRHVSRATWSYTGKIAALKRIACLLQLDKPKTAGQLLQRVEQPFVGDAAYGLYWLLTARLAVAGGETRTALDAAIKSVCFENKDTDTFPDALLVSAACYEKLEEWHRARDVYYEVARVFPGTDWRATALDRLAVLMEKRLTEGEESTPIESVFFGLDEDVNKLARDLLEGETRHTRSEPVASGEEDNIDLDTAE